MNKTFTLLLTLLFAFILITRLVNGKSIEVIGHRGSPYKKVGNTIESIHSAWKNGDASETDLQITTDETIVLFHDDYIGHAGFFDPNGKQQLISKYTFKELEQATFNQNQLEKELSVQGGKKISLHLNKIPHINKLDDILPIPKNKKLYLELKCLNQPPEYKHKLSKAAVDWVSNNSRGSEIIIISFDPECLILSKERDPKIITGLLTKDLTKKCKGIINSQQQILNRIFITSLQIHLK